MKIPFPNPAQNNQMPSFQQEPQPVIRSHPPATLRQINPSSSSQQAPPRMHQNASLIPQNNNPITEASPELMMRRRLAAAANPQQSQLAGFSLEQQREMLAYLQQQQNLQGQNVNHLGPHRQQSLSQRQQQNIGQNVNLLASNHQQLWSQRPPQNPGQNVNRLGPYHQQTLSQRQQQTLGQNVNPLASNPQKLMSQRQQQNFGQNVNRFASNHQQLSSQRQPQNLGQNANSFTLNHQQLSNQRQQQNLRPNVNLSGPHHVESNQRSTTTTQQQTCYRQMNNSQVQIMQMPKTQQNGQPRHHTTGMPASTVSSEKGQMNEKVQILKTNYVRPLTSIYQKLNICLQNLDKQNVRKFGQVVKVHQVVANMLKVLDKMENNIARITEKNLADIENRIKYILSRFTDKKPGSTSVQHDDSSVKGDAMSQQSGQLDTQTTYPRANQERMKQPMQKVNQKLVETNMQQRPVTNSMTGYRPPLPPNGTQNLQRSLVIKDTDQTSLSGNSTMPTHCPSQQSVKIPIHGQVSASNPNTLEQRSTPPKQMPLKQQDVQTQKLQQSLLHQNPQPVTNSMTGYRPPIPPYGTQNLQRSLVIKDTDQTSLSRNSTMPTHCPSQQSVKIPIHGQVSASNSNTLEQRSTPPKQMPLKQQAVQTQKLQQPLLQQNPQPVRPHSEAFPHPLAQNHGSLGQQVLRNTCQSDKNSLPVPQTAPQKPLNNVLPPPSSSSSAPKDTPPMPVNSERPTSEAAVQSSVGNIGDEEVRAPAEAPYSTTSVPVISEIPLSDAALQSSCVGNIVDERVIAPPEAPSSSITSPENPNDAVHCEKSMVNSDEVPPIQRLINVISSISNQALVAGASDIASVAYNRFDIKRRRWTFPDTDAAAVSGSETCRAMKRPRLATKEVIEEEIETINEQLRETEVKIMTPSPQDGEGIKVMCSGFIAKEPIPGSMPSQWITLRILVPADYPLQSPKVLDNLYPQAGHESDSLSTMVLAKLGLTLRNLEEPFSLEQLAVLYDKCAREVICDCVLQHNYGKGTSGSPWAKWKSHSQFNVLAIL